ncbi:hypothetical protein [Streptodolium elevatio]
MLNPHDTHGFEGTAFVVRARRALLTEDEPIAWCRARAAARKYRAWSSSATNSP